jgi:hypothetical protein
MGSAQVSYTIAVAFSILYSSLGIYSKSKGAFLTPCSGMGKSESGSGMNNLDHVSESGRDPGWKKFGSGIRNKHPGFATLHFYVDLAQIAGEWRSQRQQHSHGANRREVTVVREGHLPSDKASS